jgi:alanyl-tRNA synthetase
MPTTVVTFPNGSTTGEAVVTRVAGDVAILDATPFHPVDHTWPDQPGDAGVLRDGERHVDVVEAVMAAEDADGALFVGDDIPIKRGTEGWTWLVAHRLADAAPAWLTPGVAVTASVDGDRRAALSRGHTACHLASLALDAALSDLWRKDPGTDPLGNPDFESRANQTSSIRPDGSVDEYRLGKSLRKAGFDSEGFAASLAEREQRINAQLATWMGTDAASRIVVDGPAITDRRRWEADLPERTVGFLCGGTHVASLAEFASVTVTLALPEPQLLVMTTTVVPA